MNSFYAFLKGLFIFVSFFLILHLMFMCIGMVVSFFIGIHMNGATLDYAIIGAVVCMITMFLFIFVNACIEMGSPIKEETIEEQSNE